ncbi:hypothetical protein AUJ46_01065 [Candidatus Peregrinibacteria bacterium CG1_02_54_53]|nr:MAG: hypothetical protein AUJ46_01065 [Candidatus Peregrinibacteria bacterium CG1_02_54_53]
MLERTRTIGLLDDDLVEVVLAAYISKEIEKRNPIWIMLVGNPSSNKTQLVTLLAKAVDTVMIDVLTTNPFISGLSNKEKPQDLLPKLDGKCFIVKDYTSFFGRSEETVKQLLSDLVSIYDGNFSKHSGARGTIRYEAAFSHIGCVTPMGLSQRQRYMNQVGARFLTIRVSELNDEQREECFGIAWSEDLKERITAASQTASDYITSLCGGIRKYRVQLQPVAEEIRRQLNLLAELVARARGEVRTRTQQFETEEGEVKTFEEVEEIQKEEPFRALHQLKALCRSLAILKGKEEVTQQEFLTAKRVALSSMPVQRAEALSVFHAESKVTAKEGSDILDKNYKTVKRHLDQLVYLGVLQRVKDIDGKTWIYEPHPKFRSLILPSPVL